MDAQTTQLHRRPMGLRENAWLRALARGLQQHGATPNTVSLASIACAALGGACLLGSHWAGPHIALTLLLLAPALMGLRGLCNLIDGMIAVEGGLRTRSGEVFNDVPDRVSDLILFAAAGYAALETSWGVPLGWTAGALAIMTAYARLLGGALGTPQFFTGPMAKPHRMAVLSLACVAAAVERIAAGSSWSLVAGLGVIAAGCVVTTAVRVRKIVVTLESA